MRGHWTREGKVAKGQRLAVPAGRWWDQFDAGGTSSNSLACCWLVVAELLPLAASFCGEAATNAGLLLHRRHKQD